MKSLIICVFITISISAFSQDMESSLKEIDSYVDSVNTIIMNSSGLQGEVFCNSINTKRNVRAIGLQNTEINFYFMQKEDSVYENENDVMFIPQYNPPLKIQIEYNIAASQTENISYYYNKAGALVFYHRMSEGAYGSFWQRCWFDNNILIKIMKDESSNIKTNDEITGKPQHEDLVDGDNIKETASIYLKEYYNLFELEMLDK